MRLPAPTSLVAVAAVIVSATTYADDDYYVLPFAPMVFGDGNGKAPAPIRGKMLIESAAVAPSTQHELSFDSPTIPDGKEPFLFFRARIDYHSPLLPTKTG